MPYKVIMKNGKYAVQNILTKKTHGFTTKLKAEAQKRILDSAEKKK